MATFIELRDVFIHSQFSGINIQMRSHDALQHAQQLYDNLAPYLFHNIQSGDNKAHFMMLLRKSPYFDPLVREINRMQVQKENLELFLQENYDDHNAHAFAQPSHIHNFVNKNFRKKRLMGNFSYSRYNL